MPDEITRLREENRRLRDVLARHGIELPSSPKREPEAEPPTATLSNDQKVTLFRALFRGREDVYVVRWESPDGRSGYTQNRNVTGMLTMLPSQWIASESTGKPGNTCL
jgi:hypothetical protein